MFNSDPSRSVTVTVCGTPITIRTTEPEEKIGRIGELVDAKMRDLADRSQVISSLKVAIITAMQLASELPEFREAPAESGDSARQVRIVHLIHLVDEALAKTPHP